ncbi:MAG: acyl-phosphate glycerol 3-phosphate acyltransferase [Dethiosulfovibrio peptidovorans]|nr:MAG: acyl-phosphate glycerol 3-phosphate acyltransferase [Dethiosulfovibrio peptidovorans]
MIFNYLLWLILGYLAGSFPTAYVVASRFRGVDIRTLGSGNVGATNLGRLMGRRWAVIVALTDMLKGGFAVLMVGYWGGSDTLVALVAVASVFGHNYPVWLGFRGGKGVSTTYGTLFFSAPWGSMIAIPLAGMVWWGLLRITRYVSLASVGSLYAMALFLFLISPSLGWAGLFLSLLSTWRHRSNLRRIVAGQEEKVENCGFKGRC